MQGYYNEYGGNGYIYSLGTQSTIYDTTVKRNLDRILDNAKSADQLHYIDAKTLAIGFTHQGYILDIDKYFVVNL